MKRTSLTALADWLQQERLQNGFYMMNSKTIFTIVSALLIAAALIGVLAGIADHFSQDEE